MGKDPQDLPGLDPFRCSRRNFIIMGHRAVSDGSIFLNDLCGASGRWDGLARALSSGLFLSHDMRRDTSIHLLLLGPPDPPKVISIDGARVKYLNPDERASAALMRKNLRTKLGEDAGTTLRTSPGIHLTRGGLETILDRIDGPVFLLHESGEDLTDCMVNGDMGEGPWNFFLSDDMEFTDKELSLLRSRASGVLSVSPLSLHTYQAMILVHNALDRFG